MHIIFYIFIIFYGFLFSSMISFAHVFTDRCRLAFYETSRKTIKEKWKFILTGRSHCESCGSNISFLYLFPVFGFLFSGGKCSHCRNNIPKVHLIEETLAFIYGALFFYLCKENHVLTVIMSMYILLCYFISVIDYKYFIIPDESIILFLCIAILEKIFFHDNVNFILLISIPITWFALFHLIYYLMPGKMGWADIHLVFILSIALGYPHSLYLPTVASFMAILYFFIKYRKLSWETAKLNKIPFGLFLSLAFLFQKLIPI